MLTRFKKAKSTMLSKGKVLTALVVSATSSSAYSAGLPQSTKYTADAADGDYSAAFKSMFNDNVSVVIVAVGVLIFCAAAYAVVSAFLEYRAGKKELGDVGVVAAAGAVILTIAFFLLTQAESML